MMPPASNRSSLWLGIQIFDPGLTAWQVLLKADTLYLFCVRRTDRIKGLVWERDGYLLLYKRLQDSRFQWPRNAAEVQQITSQQFRWLMEGLTITPKKAVKEVDPPQYLA